MSGLPSEPAEPHLISLPEAAQRLGISDDALRRVIKQKGIPTGYVSGRHIIDARRLPVLFDAIEAEASQFTRRVPRPPSRRLTRHPLRRLWRLMKGPASALVAILSVLQFFGIGPIPIERTAAAVMALANGVLGVLGWRLVPVESAQEDDASSTPEPKNQQWEDWDGAPAEAWTVSLVSLIQAIVLAVSLIVLSLSFWDDDPTGVSSLDSPTATPKQTPIATPPPTTVPTSTPTPTQTPEPTPTPPTTPAPTPEPAPTVCGTDIGMPPCVPGLGE